MLGCNPSHADADLQYIPTTSTATKMPCLASGLAVALACPLCLAVPLSAYFSHSLIQARGQHTRNFTTSSSNLHCWGMHVHAGTVINSTQVKFDRLPERKASIHSTSGGNMLVVAIYGQDPPLVRISSCCGLQVCKICAI